MRFVDRYFGTSGHFSEHRVFYFTSVPH